MAPTTRAANVPTKQEDSSAATPRKVPSCTKCKRPRAGHPRSGCPYADSPTSGSPTKIEGFENEPNSSPLKGRRKLGSDNLDDIMGSMHIQSSPIPVETEQETRAMIQGRRRKSLSPLKPSDSLISLSSSSNEIVESLLRPGAFDDEDTEPEESGQTTPTKKLKERGKSARVVRWQETLVAATPNARKLETMPRSTASTPMPGTLITPNSSFFDSYASIEDQKPHRIDGTHLTEASFSTATSSPKAARLSSTKPLSRSMSMEQRQMFISRLGAASKATIYILPLEDIHEIADAAREVKFIANVVTSQDEADDQGLLIIGRDELQVEKLVARVQAAEQAKATEKMTWAPTSSPADASEKPRSSTSSLRAAAGGAVVGAVGAWSALAFC